MTDQNDINETPEYQEGFRAKRGIINPYDPVKQEQKYTDWQEGFNDRFEQEAPEKRFRK